MAPDKQGYRGASVACVVPEGGDALAVGEAEEFEVVEQPAPSGEAGKRTGPSGLSLVAVAERDVCVVEGDCDCFRVRFWYQLGCRMREVQSSSGSSFKPMMRCSFGAFTHEPSSISVAPTSENSLSSKMRTGLRSTLIVYPASRRALVVVGVTSSLLVCPQ